MFFYKSLLVVLLAFAAIPMFGCSVQPDPLDALMSAIDNDDMDAARNALAVLPDLEPDCGPNEICKPLARAAGRGNLEMVRLLVASGADPNGKNAYADTAFIIAENSTVIAAKTAKDVNEIQRYLIQHGTDVNQPNAFGITPFMGICASGDLDLASLALDHGADVNAAFARTVKSVEPDCNSALMWAAAEGQAEIVDLLLQHHADPNYKNTGGQFARDFAESNGHDHVVAKLVAAMKNASP